MKDKYKAIKNSLASVKEILMKQGEQQKIKIMKLQARLFEAQRATKFQIMT